MATPHRTTPIFVPPHQTSRPPCTFDACPEVKRELVVASEEKHLRSALEQLAHTGESLLGIANCGYRVRGSKRSACGFTLETPELFIVDPVV